MCIGKVPNTINPVGDAAYGDESTRERCEQILPNHLNRIQELRCLHESLRRLRIWLHLLLRQIFYQRF